MLRLKHTSAGIPALLMTLKRVDCRDKDKGGRVIQPPGGTRSGNKSLSLLTVSCNHTSGTCTFI